MGHWTGVGERWGGRAPGVSAWMSVTVPRLFSLWESTHPVKGQAGRHRLLRTPGMSTLVSPPRSLKPPQRCLMSLRLTFLTVVLFDSVSSRRKKTEELLLGVSITTSFGSEEFFLVVCQASESGRSLLDASGGSPGRRALEAEGSLQEKPGSAFPDQS